MTVFPTLLYRNFKDKAGVSSVFMQLGRFNDIFKTLKALAQFVVFRTGPMASNASLLIPVIRKIF